ncbi:MAG TPA: hypothetical protein VMM76_08865 [Pirellulaceae bacterium]|nr:hypothetical protein [Pirellulaceae bacterium]
MKSVLREAGGILGAFVAWWATAVLLGMLMFAIWPPGGSYTAGITLEPQNIPGNALGFILALFAFRAMTRPKEPSSVAQREQARHAAEQVRL